MKGSVFDVVAYIARHYGADGGAVVDPQEIREELLDAGFEEDDVERGIAWLRRLRHGTGPARTWMAVPPTATRCATPEECAKLSAQARGFLLRLERGGLIDVSLREAVYERALALDVPEIGLDEVRVLVALLLKASPAADDLLISGTLQGDLGSVYH